jgi:hypothetical protein
MKRPVLVLLALLSLISVAQSMAQIPSGLTPARSLMSGCNSSYDCPTGQICCYMCGNPPAEGDDSFCRACVTPVKGGGCPLVV